MNRQSKRTIARGFMLLEMLLLLPVLALFLAMVFWGFRAQMSTHKRLAAQADRHAVMRPVLNQMRSDFAEANSFEFEAAPLMPAAYSEDQKKRHREAAGNSSQSLRVDVAAATIHLSMPRGAVTYTLVENAPLYDHPNDTTQRDLPPPSQRLERVDADGETRTWSMFGQTLDLKPGVSAPARTLDVCFKTHLQSEGSHDSLRRFETTLVLGGGFQ